VPCQSPSSAWNPPEVHRCRRRSTVAACTAGNSNVRVLMQDLRIGSKKRKLSARARLGAGASGGEQPPCHVERGRADQQGGGNRAAALRSFEPGQAKGQTGPQPGADRPRQPEGAPGAQVPGPPAKVAQGSRATRAVGDDQQAAVPLPAPIGKTASSTRGRHSAKPPPTRQCRVSRPTNPPPGRPQGGWPRQRPAGLSGCDHLHLGRATPGEQPGGDQGRHSERSPGAPVGDQSRP